MALSQDTKDRIKALWLEGKSASEIGPRFGMSRSAICGAVYRMGLGREKAAGVPKPKAAPRPRKPAAPKPHPMAVTAQSRHNVNPLGKKGAAGLAVVAGVEAIKPDMVTPTAKPWLERGRRECQWPIIVAGETLSCCAPTEETYCLEHKRIAYAPVSARKRDRFQRLANLR